MYELILSGRFVYRLLSTYRIDVEHLSTAHTLSGIGAGRNERIFYLYHGRICK